MAMTHPELPAYRSCRCKCKQPHTHTHTHTHKKLVSQCFEKCFNLWCAL